MRKVLLLVAVLALESCATQKSLYYWDKYEVASYNYLKNSDEKSTRELAEAYRNIIAKQNGSRQAVPPGVYADYGFILLQANRTEEGKAMLLKEVELYPESRVFIDRILRIIEE